VNNLPIVISIGMQKGGVGKTTLSVNIAGLISYLLSKKGEEKRVLLIDIDPQA
jgi:cellulose biosynthesis protein BcsQ